MRHRWLSGIPYPERKDSWSDGSWLLGTCRRKYADALKAIKDKEERKGTLAYDTLKQIGVVYKLDNELAELTPKERQHRRQLELTPLVDAYFEWVKNTRVKSSQNPRQEKLLPIP